MSDMHETTIRLLEVHGDGACHICGFPKSGDGSPICSYPHAMLPTERLGKPFNGLWTWERATDAE